MTVSGTRNCSGPPLSYGQSTEGGLRCQGADQVLRSILTPSYALLLIASLFACALAIFALKRANKQTLTARLLLWSTVTDTILAPLTLGVGITTIILDRWVFGASICQLTGYLTVTLRISSILILLLLAVVRYLAVSSPCASRETTLYKVGEIGVILATLIGAIAAALPFVNYPGYTYIEDIFRCDLDGGLAVQMTSLVFIVLPSIVIIGLTVLSLQAMKASNWQWGSNFNRPITRGVIPSPTRKLKATPADMRANKGLAIALLSTGFMTLLFVASHQLGGVIPLSARKPLLLTSEIIYWLCPTIRSTVLLATSPVLKSVLTHWLLPEPQGAGQRNFRLIQQRVAAPSPSLEMVYLPERTKPAVTMIATQGDSSRNSEPSTNANGLRRISPISTISCDLFLDTDKDACGISLYEHITTGWTGNDKLSQINSTSDSVSMPGSLENTSGHGQTPRRQSVAALISLCPTDVRYHHHSYSVPQGNCTPSTRRQRMSLPGTANPRVSLPQIPRISVASDGMPPVYVD